MASRPIAGPAPRAGHGTARPRPRGTVAVTATTASRDPPARASTGGSPRPGPGANPSSAADATPLPPPGPFNPQGPPPEPRGLAQFALCAAAHRIRRYSFRAGGLAPDRAARPECAGGRSVREPVHRLQADDADV